MHRTRNNILTLLALTVTVCLSYTDAQAAPSVGPASVSTHAHAAASVSESPRSTVHLQPRTLAAADTTTPVSLQQWLRQQDQHARTTVMHDDLAEQEPQARELPPASDSTLLYLSALGTLGLFQAGRSVRKIHFGNMPDWFHSGAPAQIGHVVRVESTDMSLMAVIPAILSVYESDNENSPYTYQPVYKHTLRSQYLSSARAPRAPPQ